MKLFALHALLTVASGFYMVYAPVRDNYTYTWGTVSMLFNGYTAARHWRIQWKKAGEEGKGQP